MFRQPLSEKEVIRATRSAEIVYKDQNKDYKYKNETLINLLEITDEEQKEMKTIISKDEYRRRDREYQKKNYKYDSEKAKEKYKDKLKQTGKITKKEEISLRREKIKDLLGKGLNQKEIYTQLNISKRTCINDIKILREQGLI